MGSGPSSRYHQLSLSPSPCPVKTTGPQALLWFDGCAQSTSHFLWVGVCGRNRGTPELWQPFQPYSFSPLPPISSLFREGVKVKTNTLILTPHTRENLNPFPQKSQRRHTLRFLKYMVRCPPPHPFHSGQHST